METDWVSSGGHHSTQIEHRGCVGSRRIRVRGLREPFRERHDVLRHGKPLPILIGWLVVSAVV